MTANITVLLARFPKVSGKAIDVAGGGLLARRRPLPVLHTGVCRLKGSDRQEKGSCGPVLTAETAHRVPLGVNATQGVNPANRRSLTRRRRTLPPRSPFSQAWAQSPKVAD